jgi:hypothetical protein
MDATVGDARTGFVAVQRDQNKVGS